MSNVKKHALNEHENSPSSISLFFLCLMTNSYISVDYQDGAISFSTLLYIDVFTTGNNITLLYKTNLASFLFVFF